MKGADYSFARPSMSSLTSLGVRWVGRYLTGAGKALTVPERDELHAAGVGIVAIFEAGASDAIRGAGQGSIDGQQARAAAQALGFPASTVIYWTVDQDTRDLIDVEAYGRAFAGAAAPYLVGDYAEGLILADGGVPVSKRWQTSATGWSGGRYGSADIYQGGQALGGDIDLNETTTDDFGAWWPQSAAPAATQPAAAPIHPDAPPTNWSDNMVSEPHQIPIVDALGNGAITVPGGAGRVVNMTVHIANGYPQTPKVSGVTDKPDGSSVITFAGGSPGSGPWDVTVWLAAPA